MSDFLTPSIQIDEAFNDENLDEPSCSPFRSSKGAHLISKNYGENVN